MSAIAKLRDLIQTATMQTQDPQTNQNVSLVDLGWVGQQAHASNDPDLAHTFDEFKSVFESTRPIGELNRVGQPGMRCEKGMDDPGIYPSEALSSSFDTFAFFATRQSGPMLDAVLGTPANEVVAPLSSDPQFPAFTPGMR